MFKKARPALLALLLLLPVQGVLFSHHYPYQEGFYWNGEVYANIIHQFKEGGFSLSSIDYKKFPPFADNQPKFTFIQASALYILMFASIQEATGLSDAALAAILSFFGFLLAAWFLFMISFYVVRADWLSSAACSVAFLALVPTTVMYAVKIHPESVAVAMTALFVLLHGLKRYRMAAATAFLAMMTKGSFFPILFLFIAEGVIRVIRLRDLKTLKAEPIPVYSMVFAVAYALPRILAPDNSPPFLHTDMAHQLIYLMNWDRAFGNIFYNFDVLWIPFVLQLSREDSESKARIFMLFIVLTAGLLYLTDWWRNWLATGFAFIIPLAAKFFHERVHLPYGPRVNGAVLGLALFPVITKSWHQIHSFEWSYVVLAGGVIFFLMLKNQAASRRTG